MAIIRFEVPEDSDLWPCPEACGGFTEDPYGGPCTACWDRITGKPCARAGLHNCGGEWVNHDHADHGPDSYIGPSSP